MSRELGEGRILVRVDLEGKEKFDVQETEGESCEFMQEGLEIESFLEGCEFPSSGLYEVTGIVVTHYPGSLWEDADHDVDGGDVTMVPEEE